MVCACRFQRWTPGVTDDLTFTLNIRETYIEVKLVYLGPKQQLDALMYNVSGLTGFPGARYASVDCDVVGTRWWLVNSRFPPVCKRDWDQSIVERMNTTNRISKDRKADKLASGYFRELIPAAGWKELQALMLERRGVGLQARLFQFKAFGGYLETVPDHATPFPHRKVRARQLCFCTLCFVNCCMLGAPALCGTSLLTAAEWQKTIASPSPLLCISCQVAGAADREQQNSVCCLRFMWCL
jgi:hypothetical protein